MNAVILMTRVPHPGSTKTRLMPLLTPQECAQLHACFLKDYEACFSMLERSVNLFVAYAPEHASEAALNALPRAAGRFPQLGDDLGQRMAQAIQRVLSLGYQKVVLVGADIPHIQPHIFTDAFAELDQSDLVFGPTVDGGYYLVGMKTLHRPVFAPESRWGTHTVLEAACRQANDCGLSVALLQKYRDIDTPEDLLHFYREMGKHGSGLSCFPINTFKMAHQLLKENLNEDLQPAN